MNKFSLPDFNKLKSIFIQILVVVGFFGSIWLLVHFSKQDHVYLDEYECFIAVGYDCSTCVLGGGDYVNDLRRCENALEKLDRGEAVEVIVPYYLDKEMPVWGELKPKK